MAKLNEVTVAGNLTVSGSITGIVTSINVRLITSGTSFTPSSSSVRYGLVIITGGGGGGGGADTLDDADDLASAGAGGGGAGGTIMLNCTYTELNGAAYSIGGAGTVGSATNGTSGTAGGNTTFTPVGGSVQTATGGSGGTGTGALGSSTPAVGSFAGGAGGTPTGSAGVNFVGGSGDRGWGMQATSGLVSYGGGGGKSFWNGNTISKILIAAGNASPADAQNYGCGGAGAVSLNSLTGAAGGAASGGVLVVLEFL